MSLFEVYKQATRVLAVLFHAVIPGLNVFAVQKPQYALLQCTAAFSMDDFDFLCTGFFGLIDNLVQRTVQVFVLVVDIVQIQLQAHDDAFLQY